MNKLNKELKLLYIEILSRAYDLTKGVGYIKDKTHDKHFYPDFKEQEELTKEEYDDQVRKSVEETMLFGIMVAREVMLNVICSVFVIAIALVMLIVRAIKKLFRR